MNSQPPTTQCRSAARKRIVQVQTHRHHLTPCLTLWLAPRGVATWGWILDLYWEKWHYVCKHIYIYNIHMIVCIYIYIRIYIYTYTVYQRLSYNNFLTCGGYVALSRWGPSWIRGIVLRRAHNRRKKKNKTDNETNMERVKWGRTNFRCLI